MRLTAKVRASTGATANFVVTDPSAEPTEFPAASRVEITDTAGGFLLLRFSDAGAFAGDTWHATLAEAQRQAMVEFSILEDGWVEKSSENDPK